MIDSSTIRVLPAAASGERSSIHTARFFGRNATGNQVEPESGRRPQLARHAVDINVRVWLDGHVVQRIEQADEREWFER